MGIPGIHDKALQPQWDVVTHVVLHLVQQAGVRTIYWLASTPMQCETFGHAGTKSPRSHSPPFSIWTTNGATRRRLVMPLSMRPAYTGT